MNNEISQRNEKLGVLGNITGRVQGVGFRHYTQLKAKSLNLTGTVRNLTDGSVTVEAYGDDKQIKAFISWCQEGPDSSVVTSVRFQFIDWKEVEEFVIVR